jgi:hypothetical protein
MFGYRDPVVTWKRTLFYIIEAIEPGDWMNDLDSLIALDPVVTWKRTLFYIIEAIEPSDWDPVVT